MKTPSLSEILTLALLSILVVLPFHPDTERVDSGHAFEIEMSSSSSGELRLYFDDGRGLRESLSRAANVAAGDTFTAHRLPIPGGKLRAIRVDPINAPAHLILRHARIVRTGGGTERTFAPEAFIPTCDIASATVRGDELAITTTADGIDPQLTLRLDPPLVPLASLTTPLGISIRRALIVFTLGAAVWFALVGSPRAPRLRARIVALASARPRWLLAALALAAAVGSSYPVLLLGRSFVSPNFADGTILLYPRFPTLPGYDDPRLEDAKGSDVGAMAWSHGPAAMVQHDALFKHGELPLWNRYNSGGVDLLGQGQLMFGDPIHLLVIAADGAAWAWDAKYVIAKFIFALALGLAVLAATASAPAAWLTAATAPFIGFFIHRVNHPAFFSLCYSPLILLAWLHIASARDRREMAPWTLLLVIANLMELTSGTAKEAYMLILSLNFAGVLVLAFADLRPAERLRRLAIQAAAGAAFLLLMAPIWVTFLGALKASYTSYNAPSAHQIHPALALGFFDELFYRPLHAENRVWNPSLNILMLVGLAYVAVTWRRTAPDRVKTALALAAIPPAALAFGIVPRGWIMQVPFLANVAHVDNTFSCVLIILGIVLAGFGWKIAAARLGTSDGRADLPPLALVGAGLVAPWLATQQVVHREPFGPHTFFPIVQAGSWGPCHPFIWASLAILLTAATVLTLLARSTLQHGRCTPARAIAMLACLWALLWRFGAHAQTQVDAFVFNPATRVDFHAPSPAVDYIRSHLETPARVAGFGNVLMPGWNQACRLEGISGPDALMVPEYRELVDTAGILRIWDWRLIVEPSTLPVLQPVYDLLNVRYYLDDVRPAGIPEDRLPTRFHGDLLVMESPTAWPRAFFTDRVAHVGSVAEIVALVRTGDGRPFAAALPTEAPRLPVPAGLEDRTVVPATSYKLTNNSTRFEIDAPRAGVAVLHEVWQHRDFTATVDGIPTPIVRLNGAFMGVPIHQPGRHVVRFEFRPRWFTASLVVSLLGAAGLAALIWALRRRGGIHPLSPTSAVDS